MNKCILLFSGGIRSIASYFLISQSNNIDKIKAILFDYDQNNIDSQTEALFYFANETNIEYEIVSISLPMLKNIEKNKHNILWLLLSYYYSQNQFNGIISGICKYDLFFDLYKSFCHSLFSSNYYLPVYDLTYCECLDTFKNFYPLEKISFCPNSILIGGDIIPCKKCSICQSLNE